jgi:hypothetical protein
MTEAQSGTEEGGGIQGRYANYFEVAYNACEFLFTFGQADLESERAHLHTRIITSPTYAKALSETILESIGLYEQAFGSIPEADNGAP